MAQHVYGILGGGEVSTKYLTDTLASLQAKAEKDNEADFWLILPYELQDNALTDAFADVYEWVKDNEIYTRSYSAVDEPEEEQPEVEEFHVLKGKKAGTPAQAVVKDLVKEGGELLVITHTLDWDEQDERDGDILTAIEAANQNGVVVRQLNNGMMELDLTEEAADEDEEDAEGPSEDDVRQMGTDADNDDSEAITTLTALGEEYGLNIEEEPYVSMSWSEFAEEILTTDAEKANAEVDAVEPSKQPQKHDRAMLEKSLVRHLRQLALGEGWGKPTQGYPKWFLVEHLANGTVPSDEELADPSIVPAEPPAAEEAPKARGRGRKAAAPKAAESNGEVGGDESTRALLAQVLRELADALDPA